MVPLLLFAVTDWKSGREIDVIKYTEELTIAHEEFIIDPTTSLPDLPDVEFFEAFPYTLHGLFIMGTLALTTFGASMISSRYNEPALVRALPPKNQAVIITTVKYPMEDPANRTTRLAVSFVVFLIQMVML